MADNNQTFWKNIGTGLRNAGSKIGESLATTPWSMSANAASSLIDQAFARSNMRYQADLNKDMMSHQATLNQASVDRQNAYNDPTSVSARARAAGVAPSTLLGGSPGSPGVSGASSGASLGSVGSGGSRGSSQNFFANAMNAQQLRNLSAAADLSEASAEERRAAAANSKADTDLKIQSLADIRWYNDNIRDLDKQLKQAGVDDAKANALVAQLRQAYEAFMKSNKDGDFSNSPEYLAFLKEQDKIQSIIDLNKSAKDFNEEKKETEDSQQGLNEALKEESGQRKEDNSKMQELLRTAQSIKNESDLYDFIYKVIYDTPPGSTWQQTLGSLLNKLRLDAGSPVNIDGISERFIGVLNAVSNDRSIPSYLSRNPTKEQVKEAIKKRFPNGFPKEFLESSIK